MKMKRKSFEFFVEEGVLFSRGFNQTHLRCLAGCEVARVLKEVHLRICGQHQGGLRLFKQLFHLGYYWPTLEVDPAYSA